MVLAAGGLAYDASRSPVQSSYMVRKSDSSQARRGRGPAALADGNLIFDLKGEGNYGLSLAVEDITIRGQNQVVLYALADVGVAATSSNRKSFRRLRRYFEE